MKSDPLVSAIIPTYNRAATLPRAIESIFAQTYPNIEIIIVDDGSQDETLNVLDRYGSRVRILSQANQGPSAARNAGIRAANGEIIAFLDSDDEWLPQKIEKQVTLLEKCGKSVPCCLANSTFHDKNGEQRGEARFENALLRPTLSSGLWINPLAVFATRFVLFTQAAAIRRDALEQVGGFNEQFRLLEDLDLALKIAVLGPWSLIEEPLAKIYVESPESLTATADAKSLLYQTTREHILRTALNAVARVDMKDKATLRILRWKLKDARKRASAARLASSVHLLVSFFGKVWQRLQHLESYIRSRRPRWPRAIVTPCPE